jgi:hypothetical protein
MQQGTNSMLHDIEGYAIPFTKDDAVIESGADDSCYGEPETWPAWTDANRWEPTQADVEGLNSNPALPATTTGPSEPFVPTAKDWADYHEWCKHVDELNELRRMDDAEYEARMRFGG